MYQVSVIRALLKLVLQISIIKLNLTDAHHIEILQKYITTVKWTLLTLL
jgi:hypothetical protein